MSEVLMDMFIVGTISFVVIGVLLVVRINQVAKQRKKQKEERHHVTAKSIAVETVDGTQIAYSGDVELYYEVPK